MTELFLRKRGMEKFVWFVSAVDQGIPFEEIAEKLGVTIGRVSQLVAGICPKRHPLAPGSQEAYELWMRGEQYTIDKYREEMESHNGSKLQYISGHGNGEEYPQKPGAAVGAASNTRPDPILRKW